MADIFSGGFSQAFTSDDREDYEESMDEELEDEEVSEFEDEDDIEDDEVEEADDDDVDTEDEEGDVEDEEDTEEDKEAYEFTVKYKDAQGIEKEKTISEENLPELLAKAERNIDEEYVKFVKDATPFVENLNKSTLMQQIDYYLSKGHSDQEIVNGLYQRWTNEVGQPRQQAEEEEFDFTDKQAIERKIQDEVARRLNPIEQQYSQQRQSQVVQETVRQNDMVYANALQNYGFDPYSLTDQQRAAVKEAFITYYGDERGIVDVQSKRYAQHQMNGVVKAALVDKKFGEPEKKAPAVVRKQKTVPQIVPGAATTKRVKDKVKIPRIDNISTADRKANWKNL